MKSGRESRGKEKLDNEELEDDGDYEDYGDDWVNEDEKGKEDNGETGEDEKVVAVVKEQPIRKAVGDGMECGDGMMTVVIGDEAEGEKLEEEEQGVVRGGQAEGEEGTTRIPASSFDDEMKLE